MKTKHFITFLICTAVFLGLATSCGSKKNIHKQEYTPEATQTSESPKEMFCSLADSYADWTDVSMPVKLRLIEPKNMSLSGTAKMVRNEAVYLSFRVFGFEVGSFYADNDSILLYVKAMDMYYTEATGNLAERYGISLGNLQSLVLGQAFTPRGGVLKAADAKKFEMAADGGNLEFSPKSMPKGLAWTYSATAKEGSTVLTGLSIMPASLATIDCAFGEAEVTPAGMVAPSMSAATVFSKKQLAASIDWSLDRAKWNEGLSVGKPKISKGARRVDAEYLLKMIKKF